MELELAKNSGMLASGKKVLLDEQDTARRDSGGQAVEAAGPAEQKASWWLFLAVCVCCVSPLMFGFSLSFTSPTQGAMMGDAKEGVKPNADSIVFSEESHKWYASLFNVGAVIGAFTGASISDRIGRKKTLALTALPHCIAWLGTGFARDPGLLIVLRILCGCAVGMGSAVTPCYIGEIATSSLRGSLGAANQLSVTIGIFGVNFLASYTVSIKENQVFCNWGHLALIGLALSLVLLLMLLMPESPKWLAGKGDHEAAKAALQRLRAGDSSAEAKEMLDQSCPAPSGDVESASPPQSQGLGHYRKSLLVGVGLCAFQQCSGVNAIMMYTEDIYKQAGISDAGLASMATMAAQVVLTGIACAMMERAGRRPLLLFGAACMCVSHFILCDYYSAFGTDFARPPQLAVVAVGVFIVGFSLGLGPIPWLILAEIFPTEVRGAASSLATAVNWLCSFVVCLVFKPLQKDILGASGASLMFGVICFACFVFVNFFVPETRGKSVEQVLHELSGRDTARSVSHVSNESL